MITVTLKQINAGVLDKNGDVVPYEDVTFEAPPPFPLEREKTLSYYIDAVDDIEGIEVTSIISGDEQIDGIVTEWANLNPDVFELQSDFDALKGQYWFAITEKDPGTQDWKGNYKLLSLTLRKERGRVHVYVTLN